MSFSVGVKEEIGGINIYNKDNLVKAEILGYLISSNFSEDTCEFFTENEFNIERFYKLLFKMGIDYEPDVRGKTFVAKILSNIDFKDISDLKTEDEFKALVRGAFLGSGSVNDPNKKYHLVMTFNHVDSALFFQNLLKNFSVKVKILESKKSIYIKEGEEISKFLAFIGASKSVLKFEDIRVMRDMRNNVNRIVNCETANLNKTVNAALEQIEAIDFLKKMKKFDSLSDDLIEIAEVRVNNPEATLKELGEMLDNPIGKSGVNHRLKKILDIANEIKRGN
ncbi:MAG: DNA-binding protein WhiA [Clostridia bacterium]|nr:DNA-binding protein WhiA [Clostridia bacterium]